MFAKKSLPVGTLFIILAIALAFLGVGYALWSETLTIKGTVETGEVDVEFSEYELVECVDTPAGLCQKEPEEKDDAATCTAVFSGPDGDSQGDEGSDLLEVTVTGMYPSYHCKVSFDVTSTGSVPVHVWLPEPVGEIPEWVATDFEECYDNGVQLHQKGSTGPCTIDLHFTNDQAPPEASGPFTFGWTILATQWNELPTGWIRVDSPMWIVGPTGWGGWSCPPDQPNVMGGGVVPAGTSVLVSEAAEPGAPSGLYPVYPHYEFGTGYPGETGWVAQNINAQQTFGVYAICAP